MSHIFNNTITPIKVGVKFDPPSVILVYRDKSKLRSRTIPAKGVDILTDVRIYVQQFKNEPKNKVFFDKISNNKLEKIVFILQDNMKGYTLEESIVRAKKYDLSHDNEDKNNTSFNDTSNNDLFSDSHAFDQKLAQLKNDYEDDYEMDDEEDEQEIKKQIDDLRASSEIVKSINSKKEESDEDEYEDENENQSQNENLNENKNEEDEDEDDRKSEDVEVEEIEEEINNDFPDTDEEEEKNQQSVSTISDVKAKKDMNIGKPINIMSKSSALDLLSSHIKTVKSNIYDFEEDELDEEEVKTENKEEEKIETANNHSDSDSSF